MTLPARKPNRLKNFDYSTPGACFITVCIRDKWCILSRIAPPYGADVGEGLAPPAVSLTAAGSIVEQIIAHLPERFAGLAVDRYVIMPNHIHLLLTIQDVSGGASPSPTVKTDVNAVIGTLKSLTTRRWHQAGCDQASWQRSFYDHIVRNESEYHEIAAYIDANPARWAEDRFYLMT